MSLHTIVALTICVQIALKGSRMLVALHALDLGAGPLAIGVLIAMYALFPMQLALYAGRVCDRTGLRGPMVGGTLGMAVSLGIPALVSGLAALYASAVLMGCAVIFCQVAAQYAIGALGPARRTHNFSTYSLGTSIAAFLGPLIVGYLLEWSTRTLTYAVLAGIVLIPAVVWGSVRSDALPREPEAEVPEGDKAGLLSLPGLRHAFLASAVVITGVDLFNFYMPIYGKTLGFSPSVIGIILSMQAAAAFVVRLLLPRSVRRFGDDTVLRWSLLLAAVTYVLFPLFSNPVALAALALVMGLALGGGQPLAMQLTHRHSPPGRTGEAIGMRLTFNRLTQIAVPVVFGSIGALGYAPVFWANSALLLVGSQVTSRRPHAGDAPSAG